MPEHIANLEIEHARGMARNILSHWCKENGKKIAEFKYSGGKEDAIAGGEHGVYAGMVTAIFAKD